MTFRNIVKLMALASYLIWSPTFVSAQKVIEPQNGPDDWTRNYKPFRIVGNLYYVGTYDLACFLITSPKGHILINTGLASSANTIKANIKTLGFSITATKVLLTTQAHYDHMGAMAAMKKMSLAEFMIDEGDAPVAMDGGRSDYALGGVSSYEPIKPDRLLHDGDTIKVGNTKLTMLHHPGHTKGSCSFMLDVKDGNKSYKVLIANLPTIVTEKNLLNMPEYPGIAKDYEYTLASMKSLQFDIWLASHASQFGLHAKRKERDAYNPYVFIDRKGYDKAINDLEVSFRKRIEGNK